MNTQTLTPTFTASATLTPTILDVTYTDGTTEMFTQTVLHPHAAEDYAWESTTTSNLVTGFNNGDNTDGETFQSTAYDTATTWEAELALAPGTQLLLQDGEDAYLDERTVATISIH